MFEQLDTDSKGFLSITDLRDSLSQKMRRLGANEKYNVAVILRRIVMQASLDSGGGGPPGTIVVTFEQFLAQVLEEDDSLVQRHLTQVKPLHGDASLRHSMFTPLCTPASQLFETMDVDGCGSVTSGDLRTLLLEFDLQIDDARLEDMIREHDMDGNDRAPNTSTFPKRAPPSASEHLPSLLWQAAGS